MSSPLRKEAHRKVNPCALHDPRRQPFVWAQYARSRFGGFAAPGWRKGLLDMRAALRCAGSLRLHADTGLGCTERMRFLSCFKGCALVATVPLPHAKENPYPGIRQRPQRDRMAFAVGSFALIV